MKGLYNDVIASMIQLKKRIEVSYNSFDSYNVVPDIVFNKPNQHNNKGD